LDEFILIDSSVPNYVRHSIDEFDVLRIKKGVTRLNHNDDSDNISSIATAYEKLDEPSEREGRETSRDLTADQRPVLGNSAHCGKIPVSDGYSKSIRQCPPRCGDELRIPGDRDCAAVIVRRDTRALARARDEYSPAKRLLMLPGAFEAFRYELMDSCAAEAPRRELTFRFDKPAQIPRTGGGGEERLLARAARDAEASRRGENEAASDLTGGPSFRFTSRAFSSSELSLIDRRTVPMKMRLRALVSD